MPSQYLHIFVEDHELCGSDIRRQDRRNFSPVTEANRGSLCRLAKVTTDLMLVENFVKFKLESGQKRCTFVLHWNERE